MRAGLLESLDESEISFGRTEMCRLPVTITNTLVVHYICKFGQMVVDIRGERVARMGSNHLRAIFTDDRKPVRMHD